MGRERRFRGVSDELRIAARELRRTAAPAESVLWEVLRSGRLDRHRFRRQHAIDRFILDFFCPSHRLVIELDGAVHNSEEQAARDEARTRELEQQGYEVLRFRNEEVLDSLPSVIERIRRSLA